MSVDATNGKRPASANSQEPSVPSKPWTDSDVASMLESEDTAERAVRYNRIRNRRQVECAEPRNGEHVTEPARRESRSPCRKAPQQTRIPNPNRQSPAFRSRSKISLSLSGDADTTKALVVVLLAMVVVGFFGYQVYQFTAGPPVRVMQNID